MVNYHYAIRNKETKLLMELDTVVDSFEDYGGTNIHYEFNLEHFGYSGCGLEWNTNKLWAVTFVYFFGGSKSNLSAPAIYNRSYPIDTLEIVRFNVGCDQRQFEVLKVETLVDFEQILGIKFPEKLSEMDYLKTIPEEKVLAETLLKYF